MRIRLLSQRRIAWLRKVWADMAGNTNEPFTVHNEVDGYLLERDLEKDEKDWYEVDPEMQAISALLAETESRMQELPGSRLAKLEKTVGLSAFESDLLQLCFADSVDPDLARLYAYMQDHSARNYVTLKLAARLFGYGPHCYLTSDSPVLRWKILAEKVGNTSEPARFECDPVIRNWLMGADAIEIPLAAAAHIQPVFTPLSGWDVQGLAERLRRLLNENRNIRIRVAVSGPEGTGRRSFAASVAAELGCSLLTIHVDEVADESWQQIWRYAHRYCFLMQRCPAWKGTDLHQKLQGMNQFSFPVQFVICEETDYLPVDPNYVDLRVPMHPLSYEERLAAWTSLVPESVTWPSKEFYELILRYQSTIGQIATVSRRHCASMSEAYEVLRAEGGMRLGKLARRANAAFRWDDLVLPAHLKRVLEDFQFEASERTLFWEQPGPKRLFPAGKGLIALFNGPPGTGKTMAAQILAAELQLEIYRIDLSTVVSKYVGESSKNIDRILSTARHMDVVLLFDEADAMFGKRTEVKDAHDRYANMETNFLLQAIEEHPGIIILSSNKKSGIDPAFMRRFRYVLEFPKPDRVQRLSLWQNLLREMAGQQAEERLRDQLEQLADHLELTGAQIKLSILSAIFIARKERLEIRMEHLVTGVERELMKEGKTLGSQLPNYNRTI